MYFSTDWWTTQITSKCDTLINCLNSHEFGKFDFVITVQNLYNLTILFLYNIHNWFYNLLYLLYKHT